MGLTPYAINRRGLSRSFKITNLFPSLSVAENLRISVMGQHGHRFALFHPVGGLARVAAEVDEYVTGHGQIVFEGTPTSLRNAPEVGRNWLA